MIILILMRKRSINIYQKFETRNISLEIARVIINVPIQLSTVIHCKSSI